MQEITYSRVGDYNIPDLMLPLEAEIHLGKYALLRKNYLEQNRRVMFVNLLTSNKLNEHLMEVETQAHSLLAQTTKQMAEQQGVTEQMKAENQMLWVQRMNNICHSAEEVVLAEIVFS